MSEGLHVPSVWEESGNDNEDDVGLNPREAKEFRGLAAQCQLLAHDWPDIRFCDQRGVQVRVETSETMRG